MRDAKTIIDPSAICNLFLTGYFCPIFNASENLKWIVFVYRASHCPLVKLLNQRGFWDPGMYQSQLWSLKR